MMHSDTVHSFNHSFCCKNIEVKLSEVSEAYLEPSGTSSTMELSCENI